MGVATLDVRCGIDWRDHAATSALWSGEAHTRPLRNADHAHAVAVGTAVITCLDSVPSCTTRNSSAYSFVDKAWRRCKQRRVRLRIQRREEHLFTDHDGPGVLTSYFDWQWAGDRCSG